MTKNWFGKAGVGHKQRIGQERGQEGGVCGGARKRTRCPLPTGSDDLPSRAQTLTLSP